MTAAITGVGALSPLGLDLESIWAAMLQEKNCLIEGLGCFQEAQWQTVRAQAPQSVGKIAQLSFLAAQEAMARAGWDRLGPDDGLILATNTGQIVHWENLLIEAYENTEFGKFFEQGGISTPGRSLYELTSALNFTGKSMMIVSACSASTQAVGLAAEWVKSGRVRRCLVGGAEVLTRLSTEGFRCLGLLSRERARPFDEKRAGINLSEAAAFFCVEQNDSRAVAYVRGHATNSDAYHLTAPHPEGKGTVAVFADALRAAHLTAEEIDWVHAHGTASASNDKAEGAAIEKVFPNTPISSTKAYHGHALGAAGALELAICVQALRQQVIVKSLGCETPDPAFKIRVQTRHEKTKLRYVLKNSLGFGGVNAAVILAHPSTEPA